MNDEVQGLFANEVASEQSAMPAQEGRVLTFPRQGLGKVALEPLVFPSDRRTAHSVGAGVVGHLFGENWPVSDREKL